MSLSIVPGSPIQFTPAFVSARAPLNEPSPPITTTPVIPKLLQKSAAFLVPSGVANSSLLAV